MKGRHGRVTDDSPWRALPAQKGRPVRLAAVAEVAAAQTPPTLLRPLAEYEAALA